MTQIQTNIVKVKPTSPGRRAVAVLKTRGLHKDGPFKALVVGMSKKSGRNNQGHITCRHKGGGHKQSYRIVDFKRDKDGIPATIERFEYDPNRTAYLALVVYADGERRYIIAPDGLKVGDSILSGLERTTTTLRVGDCLPLNEIMVGTTIHNIEMRPGKGAQIARSAGTSAQIVASEGEYITIRLRSGESRKILKTCRAVIGSTSNGMHNLRSLGKAGANRHRGIRPTVRGVAMNPVDHPHGGGEGKTSGGRHPCSPWAVKTKGFKTRHNKRTDKFIGRKKKK